MLALSRKKGERVVVGGIGVVEVLAIRGDKIRLGFNFPKDISVHREEVQRKVDASAAGGVGTESREGSEAPPAAAERLYFCEAVGYPSGGRGVVATSAKEAAEDFFAVYYEHAPTPIDVRVQFVTSMQPAEKFRVERSCCGDPVASLVGVEVALEASA